MHERVATTSRERPSTSLTGVTFHTPEARPRWRLLVAILGAGLVLALGSLPRVSAASLDDKLHTKQDRLDRVKNREGVLTTTIEGFSTRISDLEGRLAAFREREARAERLLVSAQARLERAQAEVEAGQRRLQRARAHLSGAIDVLANRLVDIYKSGDSDVVNVLVGADGWEDLLARSEYLGAIQAQDESLVGRVRDLRDQTRRTLGRLRVGRDRIETVRDSIAAQEKSLANARASAESKQAQLAAVRSDRESALADVRDHARVLEGDLSALQDKIAAELAAQQSTPAPTASPRPIGTSTESSSGFIWPVQGTLVSGFGIRWGDVHEGIDIAADEGTPIQAAGSGAVSLIQSEAESGGYGNYTCIDHGGGISTCYAHQSVFGTSLGASVQQGQVIGYVGNTGHSFGAHLHFEVRIDGVAVDPLGYL